MTMEMYNVNTTFGYNNSPLKSSFASQITINDSFAATSGTPDGGESLLTFLEYQQFQINTLTTGLNWTIPVELATTSTLTLSDTQTIDGVTTTNNERVAMMDGSPQAGIYLTNSSGAWSRTTDADTWSELYKLTFQVSSGNTLAGDVYQSTTAESGTLGTDDVTFQLRFNTTIYTASDGVIKTGSNFSLDETYAPTFAGLTLSNLANSGVLLVSNSGVVGRNDYSTSNVLNSFVVRDSDDGGFSAGTVSVDNLLVTDDIDSSLITGTLNIAPGVADTLNLSKSGGTLNLKNLTTAGIVTVTSSGTTSSSAYGSSNQVLTSTGSGLSWVNQISLSVGNADVATNAIQASTVFVVANNTNTNYQVAFVSGSGATSDVYYATSNRFLFNPSTGLMTSPAYAISNFTGGFALYSATSTKQLTESTVTDTELGYLSGVTSAIQTQLNGKQSTLTFPLTVSQGGTGADLSLTGGASQVLQQTSIGGAITVGQLSASALSNGVTGSGSIVLASSPTLVTPSLGVASATTINKVAITAPASGSTLTIQDGFTLTVSGNSTINQSLSIISSPSFSAVTATTFTGALSGNASTATSATSATNVAITNNTSSGGSYIAFMNGSSGTDGVQVDNLNLSYAPSSGTFRLGNSNNGTAVNNFTTSIACNNLYGSGSTGVTNYFYAGGYNGGEIGLVSNGASSAYNGIAANSMGIYTRDKNLYFTNNLGSGSSFNIVATIYNTNNSNNGTLGLALGTLAMMPQVSAATSGTVTMSGQGKLIFTAGSTIASLTIATPTMAPITGSTFIITFNSAVTSLSWTASTGSITGAPSSVVAGQTISLDYYSTNTKYYVKT